MAGRGTDIQLGGNLDLKIKEGGTNDKVLVEKTKQEHSFCLFIKLHCLK